MIIKSVEIKNIASITEAKIDFTANPLKDADLFLITGTTGAGKTTILDAICLALFRTTPRLNAAPKTGSLTFGDDTLVPCHPCNLMRRNTDMAEVVLLFEGQDGHNYEAKWHVNRGKRTVKLENDIWSLTDLDMPQDECNPIKADKRDDYPAVGNAIRTAIGLDFSQFCRTTMLAQGDFTLFLSSSADEKSAILEKITDTSIYTEIGKQIYQIKEEKRKLYQDERDRLDDITLLTDDERRQKEERKSQLNKRSGEIPGEQDDLRLRKAWVETQASDKNAIDKAERALRTAEEALAKPEAKKEATLVSEWNDSIELRKELSELESKREGRKTDIDLLTALKPTYIRAAAGTDSLYGKLTKAAEAYRSQKKLYIEQLAAKTRLEVERKKIDDHALLKESQSLIGKKAQIENLLNLNAQIHEYSESTQRNALKLLADAEDLKKEQAKLEELRIRNELWAKTTEDFAVQMRITLREHLGSDSCICPVCRQKVESLPLEDALNPAAEKLQEEFNRQNTLVNDPDTGLQPLYNKLDAEQKEALRQLKGLNDQLERDFPDVDARRALEAEDLEAITTRINQIDVAFKAAAELDEEIAKIKLPNMANLRSDFQTKLTTYRSVRMSRLAVEEACPKWKEEPIVAKEDANLLQTWQKLAGVGQLRHQIEEAQVIIEGMEKNLQEKLSGSEFTIERLEELNRLTQSDLTRMNEAAQKRKENLTTAQTTLENAVNEQKKHTAPATAKPEDTVANLQDLIDALETEKTSATAEFTTLSKDLKDDDEYRADKNNTALRQQLQKDYERWNDFSRVINGKANSADGSHFRMKAQGYVLSSLLHEANRHLKDMEPRYELERIGDSLELQLVDKHLGDSKRGTISISGGESFLVSLSLALALADFGGNIGVNTLFIDEGFGTLSGAKLQASINMLKQVHSNSGRRVGIISHREEIKENIPVQIVVDRPDDSSECTISVLPKLLPQA